MEFTRFCFGLNWSQWFSAWESSLLQVYHHPQPCGWKSYWWSGADPARMGRLQPPCSGELLPSGPFCLLKLELPQISPDSSTKCCFVWNQNHHLPGLASQNSPFYPLTNTWGCQRTCSSRQLCSGATGSIATCRPAAVPLLITLPLHPHPITRVSQHHFYYNFIAKSGVRLDVGCYM